MSENPPASPLEPPYDPWRLERLLDGRGPVADPADLALARLLAAASAPATDAELRGQDAVVAAFVAHRAPVGQQAASVPWHRSRRLPRMTAMAVGAAGAVLLGGVAAAYTGSLPDPVQQVAHHILGAPPASSPRSSDRPSPAPDRSAERSAHPKSTSPLATSPAPSPVGPTLSGPAAVGLCDAFARGGLAHTSVSYQALVKAAGSSGIEAYCRQVAHPGQAATHPSGEPTAVPAGPPAARPTASPTAKPTMVPPGPPVRLGAPAPPVAAG